MAADRFAIRHTAAQRLALVILLMQGVPKGQICEAAGCAERTLLFWREKFSGGVLYADPEETKAALAEYQALIGCAVLPPPSFVFTPAPTDAPKEIVNLGTLQDVMQHGMAPRVATQPSGADPEPHASSLAPEPAPSLRQAGKRQGSLPFGKPADAPSSEDEEGRVLALPTDVARHTGHQDGLDVLQQYTSSVVWRLIQIGEAFASSKRLPTWQFQQLRAASDIFKHLSTLGTPKTKAVPYTTPARASAARKDRGEALFALGELLERANTPKDVEAIEALVKRVQSGEINFDSGDDGEPVQ